MTVADLDFDPVSVIRSTISRLRFLPLVHVDLMVLLTGTMRGEVKVGDDDV
jgi:hypothetical protein